MAGRREDLLLHGVRVAFKSCLGSQVLLEATRAGAEDDQGAIA